MAINVSAVNDAPSGHDVTRQLDEDQTYTFQLGDFGFADIEGDGFQAVRIATLPLDGTLLLNGAAVAAGDLVPASDIAAGNLAFAPDPEGFGTPYASFTFQVEDDGGSANGGADRDPVANLFTLDVAAVNDAPDGADASAALLEDGTYLFSAADFSAGFSDPDGTDAFAGITVSGLPAAGTLSYDDGTGALAVTEGRFVSAADLAAGYLTFTPGADGNGAAYAGFAFQVHDDGGTANGGADQDPVANLFTLHVTAVNDAPIVDLDFTTFPELDVALAYTEGDAPVTIAPNALVQDPDQPANYAGYTLTAAFAANGTASDQLIVGTVPGAIDVSGADILYQGVVVATFTGGAGGTPLVIAFNSNACGCSLQAVTASIGYSNSSNAPSTLARTIVFTVNDGGASHATASAAATIAVTAIESAAVAQDDAVATDEATAISGNVFADNGFGLDDDPDGPSLTVAAVNGSAANVGNQILLASGALLTLNADGTFEYDPNGAFDALPASSSGSPNDQTTDHFTYALDNGNDATVTVTVDGLDGDDILFGGAGGTGDDTYYLDDASDLAVELAGEGRDLVYASVNYGLHEGTHVEILSAIALGSTDPLQLSGNELDNEVYGNAGANILRGGGGTDLLLGGFGDDTYYVTSGGETIFEYAGEGRDIIYTSLNHGLAAGSHVEILSAISLSGTEALQLSGNEFNQEIYGNAGANILRGGGGSDLLLGGFGDDEYYITSGGETIFEYAGQGRDIIYSDLSHGLAAGSHVEVLSAISLSSTAALNFGGNELDNYIYGNAGMNILYGGGGLDTLVGGLGDDTYYILGGNELLYEDAGGGRDTAYAFVSHALTAGAEVEILSAASLAGTDAISLTGNEFANGIFGNAGANTIDGKGGADYLSGGGGADSFAFTTALVGGNVDTIADFQAGTDRIALDDAVFAGLGLGALAPGAFAAGGMARDADDRILYDAATGRLLFDADGNGLGAAVQFASVEPGTILTASDFTVI